MHSDLMNITAKVLYWLFVHRIQPTLNFLRWVLMHCPVEITRHF